MSKIDFTADVIRAAESCEMCLAAEQSALDDQEFESAAEWAEQAEQWSQSGFYWAQRHAEEQAA